MRLSPRTVRLIAAGFAVASIALVIVLALNGRDDQKPSATTADSGSVPSATSGTGPVAKLDGEGRAESRRIAQSSGLVAAAVKGGGMTRYSEFIPLVTSHHAPLGAVITIRLGRSIPWHEVTVPIEASPATRRFHIRPAELFAKVTASRVEAVKVFVDLADKRVTAIDPEGARLAIQSERISVKLRRALQSVEEPGI
jgi:hypothetical protein